MLETMAFVVIAFLGFKLMISYAAEFFPENAFAQWINGHDADLYLSLTTIVLFLLPIILHPFQKAKTNSTEKSAQEAPTAKQAHKEQVAEMA